MAYPKKESEKSKNTWPSKKNHTYGVKDMWKHYKRLCRAKFHEQDKNQKWKYKVDYKSYKKTIND